jgi:hypothetical protein
LVGETSTAVSPTAVRHWVPLTVSLPPWRVLTDDGEPLLSLEYQVAVAL